MDQLSLHIEYLLLRHDCVIVPGIGAFIARDIPARFDRARGVVAAPRRETVFNAAVCNDDGMLANSLARRSRISFEEGRRRVMIAATDMRAALRNEGSITLGRLGVLSLGDDGQISYSPIMRGERIATRLGHMEVPVARRIASEVAAGSSVKIDVSTERRFRTDKYWYIPIHKKLARVAASVMVVAGIALSVIFGTGDTRMGRRDMASVVPVEKIISIAAPHEEPEQETEAVATQGVAPAESAVEIDNEKRYHLVVGTFQSRREAEKFAAGVSDATEVIGSKTLWRVSVASSDDRQTLTRKLSAPEIRANYPGAWVWSRR